MSNELLQACKDAYNSLPITASPGEFLAGHGNWGLEEHEYKVAKILAAAIAAEPRYWVDELDDVGDDIPIVFAAALVDETRGGRIAYFNDASIAQEIVDRLNRTE